MSDLDDRMRESLPRLVADIDQHPRDLLVVRRRAKAVRQRRRRAAVVAVAAAAVLVAFVVLGFDLDGRLRSVEPIGPAPSPSPSDSMRALQDPLTVLHDLDAAAVGIDRPLKVAAAADGNVFVTDAAQRITELTLSGVVVRQWGGPGTRPGKFRLYSGAVAVGPRGNVYVADDRAATITALSPTGQQLWRIGTPAETDPDLVGHEHLGGVDAQGDLVTANDDVGKVLYIDAAGREVDAFSTNSAGAGVDAGGVPGGHFPNGACGATLDANEDVYVNSCGESYQVQHDTAVYDPAHRLVAGWKRGRLTDSPVFGPDGRAWAVRSDTHDVVQLAVQLPTSSSR